jgi:hypothetical protein
MGLDPMGLIGAPISFCTRAAGEYVGVRRTAKHVDIPRWGSPKLDGPGQHPCLMAASVFRCILAKLYGKNLQKFHFYLQANCVNFWTEFATT